jgi:tetratricopeptide (TPR) repeat protein
MTTHRNLLVLLAVLVLLTPLGVSEDKPWREVRSPHFRVISNGGDKDARHVASAFEQMRSMFAGQFPGFRVDSPVPLLILAPEDERTTKKLVPEFWQHAGPKPAGLFFHGWERQFALVRLDAIESETTDTYAVVYHEYLHTLLHMNFHWLPTWLDEGLAEYYSYTRFEHNRTYVGAAPKNAGQLMLLRWRSAMPLAQFLEQRGSFTRDESDTQLYYGQCWALTHYLTLGPGMEQGNRLKQFFNQIQRGVPQIKAFQDTFGDFQKVQKDFDLYIHQLAFPAGVIASPPQPDDKSFSSRTMTLAETEAELASFYSGVGDGKDARTASEDAVKNDPKLALAHETLGFVALREGKDDEAVREFSLALELDSKMYRSLFAKTMLSPLPRSADLADQKSLQSELNKVLDMNPLFAPAYVEFAKSEAAQGDLARALALSQTAEKLEPSRAGYHLLAGQILLRMGRPVEAAAHAEYVASRWESPDRDEALELWNRVPLAQRPAEAPSALPSDELLSAEGTVRSVLCEANLLTLTLDQAGQPLIFKIKGAVGGFSDTLWFGKDHFTPCFHVAGLRAVVRYKKGTDQTSVGDVVSWGFRDDLPPAPNPGTGTGQHH